MQTKLGNWTQEHKPKINYTQKWREYNLSQTSEKLLFLDILQELCQYIKTNETKRLGRPRLSLKEMIFCMGILTYNTKSSRRTIAELRLCKDRQLISRVPHFNSLLNYYNNKALKQHLLMLITLSSLPLKQVEQDFAADSTGFTTSQFGRWSKDKFSLHDHHRLWKKAHIMSGVKTKIITSIEITKGTSADTIQFAELVQHTAKYFKIREVSADKAYSSRTNLDIVSKLGAIPYIPFRKGVTGEPKGHSIWRRMHQYFTLHEEEFMQHYHKRSNVETAFSMIKRKLGMHLRTKSEPAQENEILMKVLCHNIIVLIHELFELQIDISFDKHPWSIYYANDLPAQKVRF